MKILMKFAVVCVFLLPSIAEASMSDEDYATAHKAINWMKMDALLNAIIQPRIERKYHAIIADGLKFLCEFENYIVPEKTTRQGAEAFFRLPISKINRVLLPEKPKPSPTKGLSITEELCAFLTMPDSTGIFHSKLRSISVDIFGPKHYGFTLRFIPEGQTLIGPNLEKTVTLNKKTILLLRNQLNTGIDQETYGYRATDIAFVCNRTKQQKERDYQALLDAQNAPDSDSE